MTSKPSYYLLLLLKFWREKKPDHDEIVAFTIQLRLLGQGSSTPGPRPGAGPWVGWNWAADTDLCPPHMGGHVALDGGCVAFMLTLSPAPLAGEQRPFPVGKPP